MEKKKKFIDIDHLFKSKNPRLHKLLPGFVLSYLKKITHQEDVNKFIEDNTNSNSFEFSRNVIKKFNIDVEVSGIENIPANGGYIFCCNHPLGGLDAMAIVTVIEPIRKDIKFIVNDLLLSLSNLQEIFVGVNKHGKTAVESLKSVDELFSSDKAIFIFPAGLVSRKIEGKIQDLEWKKTFVTRAKKYKKDVIPVYIEGENSNFFYNLSNLRKRLGIKANIEMLYLVDEMYKQKNKKYKIRFGKPVSYSTFTSEKNDSYWANYMKSEVFKLA